MADFNGYEEKQIRTLSKEGKECIFYIHEDAYIDDLVALECVNEFICKINLEGQDIAVADLLDASHIGYFPSTLECEEDYAGENGLILY